MTLFADPYYVCEQGHLESIKHSCDFTEYLLLSGLIRDLYKTLYLIRYFFHSFRGLSSCDCV